MDCEECESLKKKEEMEKKLYRIFVRPYHVMVARSQNDNDIERNRIAKGSKKRNNNNKSNDKFQVCDSNCNC